MTNAYLILHFKLNILIITYQSRVYTQFVKISNHLMYISMTIDIDDILCF